MTRVLVLCVCVTAAACGPGEPHAEAEFERGAEARELGLTGRVVSVEASERKVTVAHDEIDGFMEAMTMQFAVKEEWALTTMAPGDHIAATLVVDDARSWLEGVVVTRGAGAEGEGVMNPPGSPDPGTPLPAITLVDQDEQPVQEDDFTDQVSVVTFIYTRCPLPDYCPLMMQRFTQAARRLQAHPDVAARTTLVAVTVDPEFDTPAVLRAYAAGIVASPDLPRDTGEDGTSVTWRFLTGSSDDIRAFAGFFGLVYEEDGDEIMHALRTAVIDQDGRVAAVLRGSQWTADDLVAHIVRQAG